LSIDSSSHIETPFNADESDFRLRLHLPLLHTLVQASDYVIEIFPAGLQKRALQKTAAPDVEARYLIRVQSAISQDPPDELVGWLRQSLEFCDPPDRFAGEQTEMKL